MPCEYSQELYGAQTCIIAVLEFRYYAHKGVFCNSCFLAERGTQTVRLSTWQTDPPAKE